MPQNLRNTILKQSMTMKNAIREQSSYSQSSANYHYLITILQRFKMRTEILPMIN